MVLTGLKKNEKALITNIPIEVETQRKLIINGICSGVVVLVNQNHILFDMMNITIGTKVFGIRKSDAAKIEVEKL